MTKRYLAANHVVVCILLVASVRAATLTVERDGSGDFTVIQDAVDASASGDTIQIGPGRYPELHSYTTPGGGWTGDVLVSIDDRDLTLVGVGQGGTVIGPEVNPGTPIWPIAIAMVWENRELIIRDLTIENVYNGVYLYGSLDMQATAIRGCDIGLGSFDCPDICIENCIFEYLDSVGILTYSGTSLLRVLNSSFNNSPGHISTHGTESIIEDCIFQNSIAGVEFYDVSMASVRDCEFSGIQYYGVLSHGYSQVEVIDCVVEGGTKGSLFARSHGFVSGSGNELTSDAGPVIKAGTHGSIEVHGSHLLSPVNNFVELDNYFEVETYYHDLTCNFWGNLTAEEISAGIWDGHDDPEINAFVLFDPFSGDPIGNEDMSWGELKQIYDH